MIKRKKERLTERKKENNSTGNLETWKWSLSKISGKTDGRGVYLGMLESRCF